MKRFRTAGILFFALSLATVGVCQVHAAEDGMSEADVEIWNRGVEAYRAGDMTNALVTLKRLILSKTHGVRASELVGAIEFSQALKRDGEGVEKPLRSLEGAVQDFQTALRSNPEDPRLNRNFTRAVDRLPELREQAHVEKVMKEIGKQDPAGLLASGVRETRSIMNEFPVALTNDAHAAVAKCEAMSMRMAKVVDTWIAVKSGVAQSVTNEQQAMTISAQVDEARMATEAAAKALGDLNPDAQSSLSLAESALTRFWKLAILPPAACDEAILAQTNSLIVADTVNGRDWQGESIDFMHVFRAKFAQWAQMYVQQAQSDTNMPPFTEEAQAEISKLAAEVETLQAELQKEDAELAASKPNVRGGGKAADHAAKELNVLQKLCRIRELLPKNPNGGGGGGQSQQDNQQNDSQKDNDKKQDDQNQGGQDQKQNQDESQNQDSQQSKEQDQEEDGQSGENDKDKKDGGESAEDSKPEAEDRQVEDMLRKAQERNDQHEADKKARMNRMPLPSNERDW